MGSRPWLALTLLLAALSGIRLVGVGYLSDDRIILAHVYRQGNAAAWTGSWLDTAGARFHRPVFTGLYDLELGLFGPDPLPAHVHHLLWHVLAAGLCFGLLLQLGARPWSACLGAALFAWNPYHPVSLGWLASRTGTVAATLTLLCATAWLRWRDSGGRRWMWLSVLAAVLAALTKESGYLAFLAPPAVDLLFLRPRPPLAMLVRDGTPLVVAGGGLLVLRRLSLGTLGGGYGSADGLLAGGAVAERSLRAFGEACLRLLGGVPPEYLGGGAFPWASVLAGALLGAMILVVLRIRSRDGARRAGAFSLLAGLMLPQLLLLVLVAGPVLSPLNCQRWYAVILVLSAGIALLADAMGRRLGAAALLGLLGLFVAASFEGQDFVRAGDSLAREIVAVVREGLESVPEDCDSVFVSGLPEDHEGLPLLWWGFEDAFRPPFTDREPRFPIYPVHGNLRVSEFRNWGAHPPVESMTFVAGGRPFQLTLQRTAAGGLKVTKLDFERQLQRSVVEAQLEEVFHPGSLQVRPAAPLPALLPPDLGSLPMKVWTEDLKRVDFFLFVPGKDLRKKTSVSGPTTVIDVWDHVRDVAFNRGRTATVFALAVGFPRNPDAPPRLSRLLAFRCQSR